MRYCAKWRRAALALVGIGVAFSCCGGESSTWKSRNARAIRENNIAFTERSIPDTETKLKLTAGKPVTMAALDEIRIADGVTARIAWGKGVLAELLTMEGGAVYPEQQRAEEVITVIREGAGTWVVNGETLDLAKDSVLYLTPGMKRRITAGPEGLRAFEVYSPVRIDHINLAGAGMEESANIAFPDQGLTPSLDPGKVYNLNEIQLTPLTPPDPSLPYHRSGANARLVWGRNALVSVLRMDPNSRFPLHNHPEDQLMFTMRGTLEQTLIDAPHAFTGEEGHVVLMPGGMVHGAKLSEFGADAIDVFWPVRPDYVELAAAQRARYEQVIAPETKPVRVAGGLTFGEGPTWLKGKLYFSDMYFRDPKNGDWTGDPERSRLLSLGAGGQVRMLSAGMQSNGTIASRNGNLLVCDMFGHRVVEVHPGTGRILETVLDKVGNRPVDGPNDLVMDAKGGVYVTDPQFTPEEKKSQPGKQVYYVAPDGTAKVVIPAGEYAMPNGVEISPDGKTFYVNNTWSRPGENFVWAYDIQTDGALANKRRFAMLNVTGAVLSAAKPDDRYDSRADGMAVDMNGRIYVATLTGVQIFEQTGVYTGTIWVPEYPISCTFGGPNYDTLYTVGESSVWSIQTKVTGFRVPEGMN